MEFDIVELSSQNDSHPISVTAEAPAEVCKCSFSHEIMESENRAATTTRNSELDFTPQRFELSNIL